MIISMSSKICMHAQHCCVVDQKLQRSVYLVANLLTQLLILYDPVLAILLSDYPHSNKSQIHPLLFDD